MKLKKLATWDVADAADNCGGSRQHRSRGIKVREGSQVVVVWQQKFLFLKKMDKSFENLGEAISLASQAELDDVKENNALKTFEELAQKLELQQRLILEGEIQKRKRANIKLNEDISSAEELVEKTHQATIKSEENMQIHMVCQKAIEASQFSLALQTAEIDYP